MRVLKSRLTVVLAAVVIGLVVSAWLGTAAKVEAEVGLIGALFPTALIIASLSWLMMMIVRYFVLNREESL